MRAAIYLRISDDREGAGLGVARQENDCRRLCDDRGWTVVAVHTDNDISASKGKRRPGYEALLDDIESGTAQVVVAWHTDRLHRSPVELERYIDLSERRSVPTVTVTSGELNLATPAGRMVARMLGSAARYEVDQKSLRQKAKARQLAEQGRVGNGGHRPFGYEKDRLTIRLDEAKWLRHCYGQVAVGRSLRSLCMEMNAAGVTTSTGKPWSMQALRYNLKTGRNTGLREHKGVIVGPAVWEPIVERDLWDRVQAVLGAPDRRPTNMPDARRYLLTGFLVCGRCGARLSPNRHAGSQRFACLGKLKGGCGGILVRYDPLEELVVATVLAHVQNYVAPVDPDRADPTAEWLAVIHDAEQRIENLVDVFGADGNALALRRATAKQQLRIDEARQELAKVALPAAALDPLGISDAWPNLDLQQRRTVLSTLIDRIVIGPARPGNRFQPDRVTIVWR